MIFITDEKTFDQLTLGEVSPESARENGLLEIMGNESVFQRFMRMFTTTQ